MHKLLLRLKLLPVIVVCMLTSACVGTVIGTAVDVAVEVVKVPFKVGGAVIDVVTGDDLSEEGQAKEITADQPETDEQALRSEQQGL
jgi:hypothetical protein